MKKVKITPMRVILGIVAIIVLMKGPWAEGKHCTGLEGLEKEKCGARIRKVRRRMKAKYEKELKVCREKQPISIQPYPGMFARNLIP